MTGYRFGSSHANGAEIYEDLKRREAISSQVIETLKIVLLHARTAGVERPQIALVTPEGGQFSNPYFLGANGCLVMLVPKSSGKDILEVFGYISGALVEDDVLLGAIQGGDEAVSYTRIEAAMLRYLQDYWGDHLRA
jgi:mannitol/fructose-specific phosphotransferase system IIA component (Ntr-type)